MPDDDNGRVTLAILGVRLEQLAHALHQHDTDNRQTLQAIHIEMRIDHDKLTETAGTVERLQDDMQGIKREGRVVGTIASMIAVMAAALGINKPGS